MSDVIFSSFSLPFSETENSDEKNIVAPKVQNTKHRIKWTETGIASYRDILIPTLATIQENWKNSSTPVSFSVALQATNEALTAAAKATNKSVDLTKDAKLKKTILPPEIVECQKEKHKAHKHWTITCEDPSSTDQMKSQAKQQFVEARKKLRQISRRQQAISSIERDEVLDSILTDNPQAASRALRSHKSTVSTKISELKVNDKIYTGNNIADGFFDSVNNLKTMNPETKNCSDCESFKFDYKLIREISKAGDKIPPINLLRAESLLHSLKPSVCDHFYISALHYIHAGPSGIRQFQFLVNSAIDNIENTTVEELNNAHACILYKGHLKDKSLAASYRTISTCPFVAKALDYYIRELSHSEWAEAQADTQFLGANMSHELGALLITETISHSLSDLNLPVFCLFLDARSAFDLTVRELFVRKLHLLGTSGQRLVYIDNRLKNRKTFLEWDKTVLGPIKDELGFEQGGISSGEFYICYNNEQIQTAQESGLGVSVGPVDVAAVGQADDVVLISNDVHYLNFLLQLTLDYCKKYHVTLAPEKTKLVAFSKKSHKQLVNFQEQISPITIDQTPIKFSTTAEHVGVIRSTDGNLPHIQGRVTAQSSPLALPESTMLMLLLHYVLSRCMLFLYFCLEWPH